MTPRPWAPLVGGMLWPALKSQMRVLLARLLGYQRPRLPRAINCRPR